MPRSRAEPFKAGVIGAAGRLGTLMVEKAAGLGFVVTAIASRHCDGWPKGIRYLHHANPNNWSAIIPELAELDVLIIAAPLTSNALHRIALDNDCNVIDVGISETVVRAALALGSTAEERGLSIVLMAGLAPGLSGLLAQDMVLQYPAAQIVDVTLLQSVRGTAGKQGVCDMLDLLTNTTLSQITQVHDSLSARPSERQCQAFSLPTPETVFLGAEASTPSIRFHTLFDAPFMNRAIRALRVVRDIFPPAYRSIRNLVATAKSKQALPSDEQARLAAVARGADGTLLGRADYVIASDYAATADVAMTLAKLACSAELSAGAGHPADFTTWSSLARHLGSSVTRSGVRLT